MDRLATLLQKLTTVPAGMSIFDVQTATRVNAMQDAIKTLSVMFQSMSEDWGGLNIIPRGSSSNPYQLGTTVNGSGATGPGGSLGYWGGFRDKKTGSWDGTAATDTWHRDRQPMSFSPGATDNTTDRPCDGVNYVPLRIFGSNSGGSYTEKYFLRVPLLDSCGVPVGISAETLINIATISGSGSAGGGLY